MVDGCDVHVRDRQTACSLCPCQPLYLVILILSILHHTYTYSALNLTQHSAHLFGFCLYCQLSVCHNQQSTINQSWWHPASKNLLRLEAGYPALRCHIIKQSTGHTHTTHTTKTKTTQNSKTAKHSHTHKTHSRSRNDERQRLSSCCQSRR